MKGRTRPRSGSGVPAGGGSGLPVRLAVVLAALAATWLASALPAAAHAVLLEPRPADGTELEAPPEVVLLQFDEPVEVPPDGVRVYDQDADRVDDGGLREGDDRSQVELPLPPTMDDGGYVVTWRVTSADGHPVAGAFTFTVGEVDAVDEALVAELFGGGEDTLVAALGSLLRGVSYVGVLVAAGAAAFGVAVARSDGDRLRARRTAVPAALVAAGASVLSVPVQVMAVTGSGVTGALAPAGLSAVATGPFGQGALVRLVGAVALVVLWRRGAGGGWLIGAGAVTVVSYLWDGHQRTAEPGWLLLSADAVHLAAGAVWLGGLVVLARTLRDRSLAGDPVGGARLVAGFSRLAAWSVLVVVVAGSAMAWALVRTPRGLTDTTYGQLLLAKLLLVGVVLVVAAYNRRRLVPAIAARLAGGGSSAATTATADGLVRRSRAAWLQLRRTVTVEAAGVVAVLAITGFLVVQQPAADELGVTGAYESTVAFADELDLQLVVDPNRVGSNEVHLFAVDATGRVADDVDDLRIELTYLDEDIGPFTVEPFAAGPGHWIASVDELRFAGDWQVRVVAAVDRFDEASAEFTVPVGP